MLRMVQKKRLSSSRLTSTLSAISLVGGEEPKISFITLDQVRELLGYRDKFGLPSFLKIFRAFYLLSKIPRDMENNPFALVMD
jgi:hypothetical protein